MYVSFSCQEAICKLARADVICAAGIHNHNVYVHITYVCMYVTLYVMFLLPVPHKVFLFRHNTLPNPMGGILLHSIPLGSTFNNFKKVLPNKMASNMLFTHNAS